MLEVKRNDAIAGDIVHEYDGIEEADNELPNWWLAIFIASVLFAGGYWLSAEKLGVMPTPAQELARFEAAQRKKAGIVNDQDIVDASKHASAVAAGKQAFMSTCVACHGEKAEGKIGPNLTDDRWLHGGSPSNIFATIRDGVPSKGMPTWGPVLGPANVKNVAAFVLTLRNTNVQGKEPQGEPWKGL